MRYSGQIIAIDLFLRSSAVIAGHLLEKRVDLLLALDERPLDIPERLEVVFVPSVVEPIMLHDGVAVVVKERRYVRHKRIGILRVKSVL